MRILFFLLLSFNLIGQTEIPLLGLKATLNSFPTEVDSVTVDATFKVVDFSNQFTGLDLIGRDNLVFWKNCERYVIDTVLTAFATSTAIRIDTENKIDIIPGVGAILEETDGYVSHIITGITESDQQCIDSYYRNAAIDSTCYCDPDSIYKVGNKILLRDGEGFVIDDDDDSTNEISELWFYTSPPALIPTCGVTEEGDLLVNYFENYLQYCDGSTWQNINPINALDTITLNGLTLFNGSNQTINLTLDSTANTFTIGIDGGNQVTMSRSSGGSGTIDSFYVLNEGVWKVSGDTIKDLGSNVYLDVSTLSGDPLHTYRDDEDNLMSSFVARYGIDLSNLGNITEVKVDTGEIATQYDLTQITDDVGIDGSGTTNTIAIFTGTETIGNSGITDNGSKVYIDRDLEVDGNIEIDYESPDNDTTTNIMVCLRSAAMPTNTGGSYIMKLAQYNSTFDKSTGELVIFNGNSDVDNGITFYNNGGVTFRASEDNELVLPNENQGSHGGALVNEEFAIIQANGQVKRSQIGVDDPILNNSNPNQYEIPYYNSDPQLLDRSLGLRFEDGTGLLIGDTNNSISSVDHQLTMDGGGISYRFGNPTITTNEYLYTGTINLSTIPSSWSGTAFGTIYGNYTSDWKFLQGRTAVIRGSTNPLTTAIAEIVGSTASEKLSRVVYPNGTNEFGYDATFRDDVNITNNLNVTGNGYTLGTFGVGISSPTSVFQVVGDARITKNNGTTQRWEYSPSTANYHLLLEQTITSGNVRWGFTQTNNGTTYNDVLLFDQGNVIIGGTDASAKLDVVGDAEINGELQVTDRTVGSPVSKAAFDVDGFLVEGNFNGGWMFDALESFSADGYFNFSSSDDGGIVTADHTTDDDFTFGNDTAMKFHFSASYRTSGTCGSTDEVQFEIRENGINRREKVLSAGLGNDHLLNIDLIYTDMGVTSSDAFKVYVRVPASGTCDIDVYDATFDVTEK